MVRYLLQVTTECSTELVWSESDDGGFRSELNNVDITLFELQSRTGCTLCLCLNSGLDQVLIQEPRSVSVFGKKYESAEKGDLAESLRALTAAVQRQCAERRAHAVEHREEIRQLIYRRVLFGTGA